MRRMRRKRVDKSVLGEAVRDLRADLGVSQEALAESASVHRTYMGGIERGERNPSFETLSRIIVALGTDWAAFGKALERQKRGR